MTCPKCGAENPEKTWQCLCGHYFVPPGLGAAAVAEEPGRPETPPASADGSAPAAGGPVDLPSGWSGASFAATPAPRPPINERFAFHGDGSTLFSIYLANLIFTILTLGIYYFWGKAKLRRYVYGQSSFAGDRFDYHGTGEELLLGSLKAGLLFGGVSLIFQLAAGTAESPLAALSAMGLFYVLIALIIPIAIVGTQRFRLSRTSWRSIRFSFRGHATDLLWPYVRDMLLVLLTLGFYSPFFQNRLRTFIVRNSYFGSREFSYNGEGWDLFFMFLKMVAFFFPTLGLYWYWYTANKHRYYWEHTSFGEVRFRSAMRGGELASLRLGNFFLVLFTLGLAYPWAVARSARYHLECLSAFGPVDLDTVFQQATAATATGEGLVDMLDAGVLDIDFGF